jgi:hypothetical protein
MQQSWEDRIAAGRLAREGIESTDTGFYIKSLLVDFFISDAVIPQKCKKYEKGVLKSYDLTGLSEWDLIVKQVFRVKHSNNSNHPATTDIGDIKLRMKALWLILEYQHRNTLEISRSIYAHALLGAIGSLFTALDDHAIFSDVLDANYRKRFRNIVFHFKFVYLKQDIEILRTLGAHFYQHCQLEFANLCQLPTLSRPLRDTQRFSTQFKRSLIICLDTHSALYEYRERVKKMLAQDKIEFNAMISYLQSNPLPYDATQHSQDTALAICGNAIGLYIGSLSANTMSLLKNRTYSDGALSKEEIESVRDHYGHYIQIGAAFRHNKVLYGALPAIFEVAITKRVIKNAIVPVKKLPPRDKPTFFKLELTKSFPKRKDKLPRPAKLVQAFTHLWGVLPNGRMACSTRDTQDLYFVNSASGVTEKTIALYPAAKDFNYFTHACETAPMLLLENNTLVVAAYQYLHIIDLNDNPEPDRVILLKNAGATALLALANCRFAVGAGDGSIRIFAADSPEAQFTLKFEQLSSHIGFVSALLYLPNNRLVAGYTDCMIRIWDLNTGLCETCLDIDRETLCLSFNRPDTKTPIIKSGGKPQGGVFCLEHDAEGNLFAGYGDDNIYLWDLKTQRPIKTLEGHTGWPTCLKRLADGRLLSGGLDKTLRIWGDDRCYQTLELKHAASSLQLTQDKVIVANRSSATAFQLAELQDETKKIPQLR